MAAPFVSSYIPTVGSAVTRNAEKLSYSWAPDFSAIKSVGGLTVLSEWVEMGAAFKGAGGHYLHIGGPGAADTPYLKLESGSTDGRLISRFVNGGTNTSATGGGAVSLFDHVRARIVIFLDGSNWKIQLHVSVNGGAETSATAATIGTSLPSAWSANTLTIGAAPDDTAHGYAGFISLKFAFGNRSLSYMEEIL